jgi:hypothetical protein
MPIGEKHEAISAVGGRGGRSGVNEPSAVCELDVRCCARRFRKRHQSDPGNQSESSDA